MKEEKKEKKTRYYEADTEKMQKKLEELGSGSFFKPKEGKNVIRILPPWSKEGVWYKEATLHYLGNDERVKAYPCLKMFGNDCPICDKMEELNEGDDEDKKLAERLRPRTKYYANVVNRATGQGMIWGFSAKTLGILLGYQTDPDYQNSEGVGDLSNPKEGYDIVIERQGTGRTDTKYTIRVKPKPSEIDIEDFEEMIKDLNTEVVEEIDEDKLQEIVDERFGEGKSLNKKKKKDDDSDDDDSDDDEEDEKDDDDKDQDDDDKKKKKRK